MKRFTFLVLIFFSYNFSLFGQVQNEEKKYDCILIVEQSATFEGGMDYFYEIINNQMRFSETMKEGRVFIQFVVEKTGQVTDMKVVKGLSEENDKEALRIMNLINEYYMWKPAEQRGEKVKVRMNIPIVFKREKVKPNSEKVYRR
ncbi:energy transducer TonB [Bernardetia sp. OM2101]|uniref:energy transducer TonB n=1 Tax=Bernardetia sp. OM2101 TaxID=3344876 RepID=UPI0035CF3A51